METDEVVNNLNLIIEEQKRQIAGLKATREKLSDQLSVVNHMVNAYEELLHQHKTLLTMLSQEVADLEMKLAAQEDQTLRLQFMELSYEEALHKLARSENEVRELNSELDRFYCSDDKVGSTD